MDLRLTHAEVLSLVFPTPAHSSETLKRLVTLMLQKIADLQAAQAAGAPGVDALTAQAVALKTKLDAAVLANAGLADQLAAANTAANDAAALIAQLNTQVASLQAAPTALPAEDAAALDAMLATQLAANQKVADIVAVTNPAN
jgi:hypothetical protein